MNLKYYRKELLLLFIICLMYTAGHLYFWNNLPNAPAMMRSAKNYDSLIRWAEFLKNYKQEDLMLMINFDGVSPFSYFHGALISLIFGNSCATINYVMNMPYLLILLMFMYLMGREIGGRDMGILSALIIALCPSVFMQFPMFIIENSMMGIIAMSVYFLYKSRNFSDLKWSLLFGIACGWGLMLKYSYAAYIAGPFIIALCFLAAETRKKNYRPLLNLCLSAAAASAIIFPHYFTAGKIYYVFHNHLAEPKPDPWYHYSNLRLFTAGLWEELLSPPFFILFVTGIYFFFFRQKGKQIKCMFLLWLAVPYLTLLMMPHWVKVRYMMPLLPVMALLSARGAASLLKNRPGRLALYTLLSAGVLQYLVFSYDTNYMTRDMEQPHDSVYRYLKEFYYRPFRSYWSFHRDAPGGRNSVILSRIREKMLPSMAAISRREIGILPVEHISYNYVPGISDTLNWIAFPRFIFWGERLQIKNFNTFDVMELLVSDSAKRPDFIIHLKTPGKPFLGIRSDDTFGFILGRIRSVLSSYNKDPGLPEESVMRKRWDALLDNYVEELLYEEKGRFELLLYTDKKLGSRENSSR
ncbi:MAG: glycosyltransferase family 39 protein [Elusimicrobia bacterium]|nr:glycosyltransferase family 39 protein [Elusimicrobiota bacterium]